MGRDRKILALWCHPRSMSTAMERIMRERGDLAAFHEPFMYDYYLNRAGRIFADFLPDPAHPTTYEATRAMIRAKAAERPVFLKDMAYYVADPLPQDAEFLAEITHAFLIRDPAAAILSYAKRDPEFALKEAGLEAQWRLYQAVKEAGLSALVIRAEDVQADPAAELARYWDFAGLSDMPEALTWDSEIPEGWETVADWHRETLASGEIRPPDARDAEAELTALGSPFTDYLAHHRPFYELLAHQK
ncbi:MAG: hypothetical protein AAF401_09145 [Pseudomonadota bacterium]